MTMTSAVGQTPDSPVAAGGKTKPHRWKFYRAGGVDQVQLRDGRDLRNLRALDDKLWVAVAMPVKGVHFDPKTLAALDSDGDGRVRLPEIVAAVQWLDGNLTNLDDLFKRGDQVALSAIKDGARGRQAHPRQPRQVAGERDHRRRGRRHDQGVRRDDLQR